MASGKHIFVSMAVLLTSQASTSSILPFAPYFDYFHQVFQIFTKAFGGGRLLFLAELPLPMIWPFSYRDLLPTSAACL